MVVVGTVAQWEAWTTLKFPDSGRYTVHGGLVPVKIDRRMNGGRYVEPNVWMLHPVKARKRDDVRNVGPGAYAEPDRTRGGRRLRRMDPVA